MTIRISIASPATRNMAGIGKTSGKPYDLNFQAGYAHVIDRDGVSAPYPEKFEFILDKGQQPYAPGDYTVSPSAFYVKDGNLVLSAGRLTPVKPRAAA